MRTIGEAMVDYIMVDNQFKADLITPGSERDQLVTAFENINKIKSLVSDAAWIDKEPS